mgnify:CR=1 FL=1
MKDMLVRLLELPEIDSLEESLRSERIIIKRPIAPEKTIIVDWVLKHFSKNWADEISTAFNTIPVNCFIAQKDQNILGFACFECTCKNFFGPTGVLKEYRGKQIGKILLIKSLEALKEMGYAYAIIGGVGPEDYYAKVVNATIISHSERSIYQHFLKPNHDE